MRVVVLGAGVVGVATAHFLAKKGIDVVVVDRADSVASGASFANGGQLSYSFTDALARPGMPAKLPSLVCGADAAISIRPPLDIEFLRWGMSFLGQCSASKFYSNTADVLRLALQSAALMRKLVDDIDIDFSYRAAGKLVLLRSPLEMDAAAKSVAMKISNGCDVRLLSFDEARGIEPGCDGEIQADAHDERLDPVAVHLCRHQRARNLAASEKNIVDPFDPAAARIG
jgi:D-amino-acid dehydrogenase